MAEATLDEAARALDVLRGQLPADADPAAIETLRAFILKVAHKLAAEVIRARQPVFFFPDPASYDPKTLAIERTQLKEEERTLGLKITDEAVHKLALDLECYVCDAQPGEPCTMVGPGSIPTTWGSYWIHYMRRQRAWLQLTGQL